MTLYPIGDVDTAKIDILKSTPVSIINHIDIISPESNTFTTEVLIIYATFFGLNYIITKMSIIIAITSTHI